jgi:S-DNA-T family DNA segregation ATPase FtsK/SpoIIIE
LLSYLDDLGAVILTVLAIVLSLGMLGLTTGSLVSPLIDLILGGLGWGAFVVPVVLAFGAWALFRRSLGRPVEISWIQVIAAEFFFVTALALLSIVDGMELTRAELGHGGGILGWSIARLLGDLAGVWVRFFLLIALAVVSLSMFARSWLSKLVAWAEARVAPSMAQTTGQRSPEMEIGPPAAPSEEKETAGKPAKLPPQFRKQFQVPEGSQDRIADSVRRGEDLPPLDLLTAGGMARISAKDINLAAGLIEKTLADFGLPARVVDFRSGPSITQFAVEPGYVETVGSDGETKRHKVRVSQISSLANDLALALSAPRLRIEAPVPGQSYVGIEVPNRSTSIVRLRPILETEAFQKIESALAIALGRDVSGAAIAADLADMPHLLIAGTTGSGKSVCINAIAACLAFNNTPGDLRFVMIDPKMVELIRYNGLPHLMGKVETELTRIAGVLRWCTAEMDRRYRLLEEARARDIMAYNQKVRRKKGGETLPRIVVMIDELADLMMMAPDQTEHTLVRLAQMARAVGLHLVVATQRPSTDILTGLIKANFPARISFAVASSVDSRVILDSTGAETLLGKGDMLYLAAEASTPVRLQGVMVNDQEIDGLIKFWQGQLESPDEEKPPWDSLIVRQEALSEHDEILEQAIQVVMERGEASASMLQRALRVGYPRAARLMDELEELGVVGRAQSGGKTREILISEDDDPLSPDDEESG